MILTFKNKRLSKDGKYLSFPQITPPIPPEILTAFMYHSAFQNNKMTQSFPVLDESSTDWLDISNSPALGNSTTYDFLIDDGYIYVPSTDNPGIIRRWDLSNLGGTPVTFSSSGLFGINAISINNGYLYACSDQNNVIKRWTISSPSTPPISFSTSNAPLRDIIISGDYIYGAGGNTIKRWSLSNPSGTPVEFSDYGSDISVLYIHDGYIYAGTYYDTNNLKRWSLSDPSGTPTPFNTSFYNINDILVDNGYLYASVNSGIVRWDINNPSNSPTSIPNSTDPNGVSFIHINSGYLYSGGTNGRLLRWNLSNINTPPDTYANIETDSITKILIDGDWLWVSGFFNLAGVTRINKNSIVQTIKPKEIWDTTVAEFRAVKVNENYVWVGGSNGQINRWSLSDVPQSPTVYSTTHGSAISGFLIDNGWLYVSGGNNIKRYSVSDPTLSPLVFSGFENEWSEVAEPIKMSIYDGKMFAIANFNGNPYDILSWDLSDPTQTPQHYQLNSELMGDLIVDNGYFYISDWSNFSVSRYTINDIGAGSTTFPNIQNGEMESLFIHDGYIYGGANQGDPTALLRWDLSNTAANPTKVLTTFYNTTTMIKYGDWLYIGTINGNLYRILLSDLNVKQKWNNDEKVSRFDIIDINVP